VRFPPFNLAIASMSALIERPSWKALQEHAARMRDVRILDLFDLDPERARDFSVDAAGVFLDYSKNPLTRETMALLFAAAEDARSRSEPCSRGGGST
jgi:glucose-6-phosphate isomerase